MPSAAPRRDALWLVVLALLLFGAGLGLRDPWPADEPRFALIARDMVLTGEWLIPRIGGELYPDKPPLFMWIVAALFRVTGNLRISFLLPSLAAGVGMLLLVHDLARRLWGREAAWLAALLLLMTVQFTLQARSAQLDALVSFWTTLAMYGLVRHLVLGPRWDWYLVAWIAMGLGVITKGVGFLPLFMFLPYLVARRRWPQQFPAANGGLKWLAGPVAMLLTIALWLVPMVILVSVNGSTDLAAYRDNILLRQTVERYADSWGHLQPPWFYALQIPWAWFPLAVLLPWLVPAWWRRMRGGDPATWLLVGWAVCVLVFFTLSPGKRHVYLLPALPALALAAGPHLAGLLQRTAVQRVALGLVALSSLAAALVLVWAIRVDPARWQSMVALIDFDPIVVVAAMAVLAAALVACHRFVPGVTALAILTGAGWLIAGWWAMPMANASRSGGDLMGRVSRAVPAGAELAIAGWKEQLLLHADRPLVHFGFRRETKAELRDAAAWLGVAPNRRLLIPAQQMAPCLDVARSLSMGHRHRSEWRLAGPEAVTGACSAVPPSHSRRYDPFAGAG